MSENTLDKKQRKELIGKVSRASGVAQYAIEKKIDDSNLLKLSENLDILALLKKSNDYNRYCQGQKTAEANSKFKELFDKFTDLKNSQIVRLGKWLVNALSLSGEEQKTELLEEDLVHKDNYNKTLEDLQEVIKEQQEKFKKQTKIATDTIQKLENKNDQLKKKLIKIEQYTIQYEGLDKWQKIQSILETE